MTSDVRSGLRAELEARGYAVGGDTVGLRGELYIRGAGDRAAALFEFKRTAEEACDTMYQGSWSAHLPPRFAVLPAAEGKNPAADILMQAGLSVLLYEEAEQGVVFVDLESALTEIDRRSHAGEV